MKRLLLFFAFIFCINFSFSQSWGIVGSATPNSWGGPDIPLTYNVDLDVWMATVALTDGEIKFRENNSWDLNYGDTGFDGSIEINGANIPVSAGYYSVSLNLNTLTYSLEPFENLFNGTWKIASEPGALKVGPTEGSDQWWYLNRDQDDLTTRACYMDDEYVFNLDGSFQNVLGEETWIEPWQGDPAGCEAPVFPHDGSVVASYLYDEISGTITVNGVGAYIGLPKVTNDNELTAPEDAPGSITYNVIFSENDNVMTLSIEVGSGVFWTYKLINQNVVSIPDTNFETYLETHTANGDVVSIGDPSSMGDGVMNYLTLKNSVESVTNLNVNGLEITSLIGIEAFSNLEVFYCQGNQLTSLDVTKNLALTNLECQTNQFTQLDLSQNYKLKIIGCANNFLTELDVSQNLLLEGIWCTNNNISNLNLDVNTKLSLYGLDDNPLTYLSIKNGNNKNIGYSTMQNLSSLSCITVDDENADNSNLNLDPAVSIGNNCSGIVAIPDPIFEQALIELKLDTDDTVNGQISQIDADNILSLEIVGMGINDLTGIEYFSNLEGLFCNNNNLTQLQLRNHPNLGGIWANNNPINEINLANCPSLVYLHISQNQLMDIDISSNPLLMELSIANNNLTSLDASNNPNLTFLRANGNDLYSINIENGNNLNFVSPDWWPYSFDVRFNNNLACIQVDAGLTTAIPSDWAKENTAFYSEDGCNDVVPIPDPKFELALINAGIDTNGETGDVLRVDVHNITYLNVSGKEITDLIGLSAFKNLNHLIIYSNPIGEIDLSGNTELEVLQAGANELTSLDISNNPKLRELWAWTNQLETLNTSNNPLLEELWLGENNITALDLSNNGNLIGLEIHKNPIAKIDLSNNLNFQRLWAWETNLTGLNLSKNGALNHLRVQDNLELSYLNVKNGNNLNVDNFFVTGTSKLLCITTDADVHENMTLYSDGRLSEDCGTVYITDENFEQALIELEIDTDGLINHLISRVDAENATEIIANFPIIQDSNGNDIVNPFADPRVTITTKIKDLTGIEAFVNLEILGASYGEIATVDLSQNTKLYEVFVNGNLLSEIDVSKNTLLTRFGVTKNPNIDVLDVSNNILLEELFIDDTAITSIDVSSNTNLWKFWGRWSNLTGIDLSNNTNLSDVRVIGSSNLTYLNVRNGNNKNVTGFDIRYMANLTCITADGIAEPEVSALMLGYSNGLLSDDCGMVYIPDAYFEQTLLELGFDTDGELNHIISRIDAEAVTDLNLTNPLFQSNGFENPNITTVTGKIADLTGIEAFVNVTNLQLGYGAFSSIDISNNVLLEELFLNDNQLLTIDVSNNTALRRLGISRNPEIREFDVSNNLLLEELFFDETAITSIDLSLNTNLWRIYARWGNVTGLDLSNNTNLRDVRVRGSNNFTYLNIRNGNNINVTGFDVRDMNNLSCITTDDVQSDLMIGYSNGITFSPDCGTVLIPDENFEQALIELEIDKDGIVNHLISKADAEAQVGRLGISGRQISDLTGIEAFVNITELQAGDNQLTKINVSQNTELIKIWVYYNQLTALDLSNNTKLQRVSAGGNQIGSFDSSVLVDMHTLLIWQNNLTSLDLTNNVNLTWLSAQNNQLTGVNIDSNILLDRIQLQSNVLPNIKLANNVNVTTLFLMDNPLNTIDITTNTKLLDFRIDRTGVSSLDLSNNATLETLIIRENAFTELDLTQLPNLIQVFADNNRLESIDVSENPNLEHLLVADNPLQIINVSDNPVLTALNIDNNTQLVSLDMRNGNNSNIESFDAENTSNLTCINVDTIVSQVMIDERDAQSKTFSEDCGDFVYIPDANFEQALIDIGVDSDGVINASILRADAVAVLELNVGNPLFVSDSRRSNPLIMNVTEKITDLTGIEAFINLTSLESWSNALTEIDVTQNIFLEGLELVDNQITAIDVTLNTELRTLWLESNALTNIDINQNTKLLNLAVGYNNLTELNVSNNPDLWAITAEENIIEEIDVRNNLGLVHFWIFNNPNFNKIDVTKNSILSSIGMWNTSISVLDLSNNPQFTRLYANDNPLLEHLDIRNGNNMNITNFNIGNTPNLTCINADAIISQSMIDTGKTFSEDCGDFVYIPDPNFEQALIDLGIDSDGVLNSSILRSDAEDPIVTSLNLNNSLFTPDGYGFNNSLITNVTGKIADLTGIEAFVNLTNLQVSYSDLMTINITNNTLLQELWVTDGILTAIDVTTNTSLVRLGVSNNNISGTVDVSQNTSLEWLLIGFNPITSLDIISNTSLWNVWVPGTQITSLDISLNLNLQRLDAQYNTGLSLITDPAGYSAMTSLNLSGTGLSNYNLYAPLFPNLQWLLLNDNNLTRFNGNNALQVQHLFLQDNQIGSLNLAPNTGLVRLNASNNLLTDLDLRNTNNLNMVPIGGFAAVNVTGNLLTCISVDDPIDVTMPYATWNIDPGAIFSDNCKAAPEVVLIPDENFEQALIALGFDTNGDGLINKNILLSDALLITELDLYGETISDLTGIEAFANLVTLNIEGIGYSGALDLNSNSGLEILNCSNNQIDDLLIAGCKGLVALNPSSNNLMSLNLDNNGSLISLIVSNNNLSSLTIAATRSLTELDASANNISQINLTELTALTSLDISNNSMSKIDVKNLDQLTSLNVSTNSLTELDVRNGANGNLTYFNATNNLNLKCIAVDDETVIPTGWSKDASPITEYTSSGDCLPPTVITQNIRLGTVGIDAKGVASITASEIDNGSYDNSTPSKNLIFELTRVDNGGPAEFTCADVGKEVVVKLKVTDLDGNFGEGFATVAVGDYVAPSASSVRTYTRDINSVLGNYIDAIDLDDGSSDNCDIVSYTLDQDTFTIPGTYTVNLIVEDAGGNTDTSLTTVEITDSGTSSSTLKFGGLTLTVYPVPFSDAINISFSKPTDLNTVNVELLYFGGTTTDIQFYDGGGYMTSDDTSGLNQASGPIYWLQVTIGKTAKTIEIIKANTN